MERKFSASVETRFGFIASGYKKNSSGWIRLWNILQQSSWQKKSHPPQSNKQAAVHSSPLQPLIAHFHAIPLQALVLAAPLQPDQNNLVISYLHSADSFSVVFFKFCFCSGLWLPGGASQRTGADHSAGNMLLCWTCWHVRLYLRSSSVLNDSLTSPRLFSDVSLHKSWKVYFNSFNLKILLTRPYGRQDQDTSAGHELRSYVLYPSHQLPVSTPTTGEEISSLHAAVKSL